MNSWWQSGKTILNTITFVTALPHVLLHCDEQQPTLLYLSILIWEYFILPDWQNKIFSDHQNNSIYHRVVLAIWEYFIFQSGKIKYSQIAKTTLWYHRVVLAISEYFILPIWQNKIFSPKQKKIAKTTLWYHRVVLAVWEYFILPVWQNQILTRASDATCVAKENQMYSLFALETSAAEKGCLTQHVN